MRPGGLAALALVPAPGRAVAVLETFADRGAFEAAVPRATTFGFDGAAVDFSVAAPAADVGPFTIVPTSPGNNGVRVRNGAFRGRAQGAPGDLLTFDRAITAFGATIRSSEGGNGRGVELSLDGVLAGAIGVGAGANNGSLGFVADRPFTEVALLSVDGRADTYTLDDVTYQVAAPATLTLLLGGGIALALRTRRRHAA